MNTTGQIRRVHRTIHNNTEDSVFTYERCHEKMYLKIFVVVIPKEGLAGGNDKGKVHFLVTQLNHDTLVIINTQYNSPVQFTKCISS